MSNATPTSPVHGWSWRRIASLVLFGGIAFIASRLQRRPADADAQRAQST